jgi:hypothetical protein
MEDVHHDVVYLLIRIVTIIALIFAECSRALYCMENKC